VRKAVIDVGSGSVVLLVAENSGGDWRPIATRSEVTLLGEDVNRTGKLKPERAAKTLHAIAESARIAREQGVSQPRAIGTAALRIAENSSEFLTAAREQGTPVSIMSATEEAHFAFLSVALDPKFRGEDRLTILDPGGHSTEVIQADRTAHGFEKTFQHSFDIGTLQLRGEILPQESPNPGQILTASTWIDDTIGTHIDPADARCVVVLGAPATDLICIRNRWATWDPVRVHGESLDFEEVGKAVGWLMRMTDAEREQVPGVEVGRGTTVHLGALILERFLNALASPGCYASVRGWRWGILDDL
jgi:exopolyphosphatase/guanosine-5'-triphosphate,3'-diphosphate pyrophosphatase